MKTLIVEDDRVCGNVFKLEMSKHGECQLVRTGEEALIVYKEALNNGVPFQLMLLDIILPGISGAEVLKLVREIEEERNINEIDKLRILITTAFDDWYNREIIIKKLNYEYENYYIKSSNIKELLDKISEMGFVID